MQVSSRKWWCSWWHGIRTGGSAPFCWSHLGPGRAAPHSIEAADEAGFGLRGSDWMWRARGTLWPSSRAWMCIDGARLGFESCHRSFGSEGAAWCLRAGRSSTERPSWPVWYLTCWRWLWRKLPWEHWQTLRSAHLWCSSLWLVYRTIFPCLCAPFWCVLSIYRAGVAGKQKDSPNVTNKKAYKKA